MAARVGPVLGLFVDLMVAIHRRPTRRGVVWMNRLLVAGAGTGYALWALFLGLDNSVSNLEHYTAQLLTHPARIGVALGSIALISICHELQYTISYLRWREILEYEDLMY
jgi:hypothetical protein